MEISIVIPTYNRTDILIECLKLLNAQTAPQGSFEVIVVDDGSEVNNKGKIDNLKKNYPFKYIYQKNHGQAGARNNGIENSKGRIILFIDDDVLVHPALVKTHLRLQKDDNNLIVRGPVINIPYTKIPVARPAGFWDMSKNFFCTSNASVTREHIIKSGMFDTEFRWWEDCELGFRLRMRGLKWKFSFQAVAYHYKPPSENSLSYIKKLSIIKGKYAARLYKKHPHWRVKLATGLYKLEIFQKLFSLTPDLISFFEKTVNNNGNRESAISSFLLEQIGTYYYFKTLKEEIKREQEKVS